MSAATSSAAATRECAAIYSEFAADPDYRELLVMFAEALPERRRCFTEAFREGNLSELKTLAHQLKGAGGGFGFPGLTEHAADLESVCKAGDLSEIATALDRTLAYVDRIAI